jgi:hypothetical protein
VTTRKKRKAADAGKHREAAFETTNNSGNDTQLYELVKTHWPSALLNTADNELLLDVIGEVAGGYIFEYLKRSELARSSTRSGL